MRCLQLCKPDSVWHAAGAVCSGMWQGWYKECYIYVMQKNGARNLLWWWLPSPHHPSVCCWVWAYEMHWENWNIPLQGLLLPLRRGWMQQCQRFLCVHFVFNAVSWCCISLQVLMILNMSNELSEPHHPPKTFYHLHYHFLKRKFCLAVQILIPIIWADCSILLKFWMYWNENCLENLHLHH